MNESKTTKFVKPSQALIKVRDAIHYVIEWNPGATKESTANRSLLAAIAALGSLIDPDQDTTRFLVFPTDDRSEVLYNWNVMVRTILGELTNDALKPIPIHREVSQTNNTTLMQNLKKMTLERESLLVDIEKSNRRFHWLRNQVNIMIMTVRDIDASAGGNLVTNHAIPSGQDWNDPEPSEPSEIDAMIIEARNINVSGILSNHSFGHNTVVGDLITDHTIREILTVAIPSGQDWNDPKPSEPSEPVSKKHFNATFTYFKSNGTYYSSGEGFVPRYLINGLSRSMILESNASTMPGLSSDASEFIIHVNIPDAWPHLLPLV